MKKQFFLISILSVLILEAAVLIAFAIRTPDFSQDTVAVNEIVQSASRDFYSLESHRNVTGLDYVILDNGGNLLYKTKSGLSESLNAAVAHRDTVLDIAVGNTVVGKVVIFNDGAQSLQTQKQTAITVLSIAIAVQCCLCAGYAVYMHATVVKPFCKLEGFAERIAEGNLDIPLEMDRQNLFGAFTESFDIMRSELKKARLAEARANASKKELVAKLSHDIKTPVASIKAASEVGFALTENRKIRENYTQIILKADQINALVTNLFSATLEELQQLSVTPSELESTKLKRLIENADYLRRTAVPEIPQCLLVADKLRLQQVFDNIFANSYKYAGTDIIVSVRKTATALEIAVEDFGGGVPEAELPLLTEKYSRGANAEGKEGAGLGLYISDCFMRAMGGGLTVENGANGLKVTVKIALC